MAELVYAFDLKSNGENHMGSSPISGTTRSLLVPGGFFCCWGLGPSVQVPLRYYKGLKNLSF